MVPPLSQPSKPTNGVEPVEGLAVYAGGFPHYSAEAEPCSLGQAGRQQAAAHIPCRKIRHRNA
jgi:hypothetical protein